MTSDRPERDRFRAWARHPVTARWWDDRGAYERAHAAYLQDPHNSDVEEQLAITQDRLTAAEAAMHTAADPAIDQEANQ